MPPAYLPVSEACAYLGVSRSRLYGHLARVDPGIVVQLGGRTLVDLGRATALIASFPRGPRKPLPQNGKRKDRAVVATDGEVDPLIEDACEKSDR
jgi:hypothetical protein